MMTYCLSLVASSAFPGEKLDLKASPSCEIHSNPLPGSTLTAGVLQAQFEHFQMEWDCLEQPSM